MTAKCYCGRYLNLARQCGHVSAHGAWRRDMIARARLTDDELATAAARFGIVADGDALPLNTLGEHPRDIIRRAYGDRDAAHREARTLEARDRMRSTGDCYAAIVAARADKTTHTERFYESSDGFDEIMRGGPIHVARAIVGATISRHPVYAAGIAARSR